jgi:predicted PurR-regulated permease PerM
MLQSMLTTTADSLSDPPPEVESVRVLSSAEPVAAADAATSIVQERRPVIRLLPAFAVIVGLWWAQVVFIPIVLSLLISYALEPLVIRLGALRIPRVLAVPLLLVSLIGVTGLGIYSLRRDAVLFIEQLPDLARAVREAARPDPNDRPGAVAKVKQAAQELEQAAKDAAGPAKATGVTPVRIEEGTFKWSDYLWQGSLGALQFFGQLFVVLCLVYYLLVSGDLFKRKIVRIVGPSLAQKRITVQILGEIDRQIERFLLARLTICMIVGAVVGLGFWALGVREAGVWGVVAAVLFAVPYVGPAVITAAAAIAGFVQFGSVAMAGAMGGLCLAIAAIEGNVLAPWLLSRAGNMNAIAVFVSLLFWGWIWGVWGLLLGVPIMAAVTTICERVDDLSGYAELLKE